MPDKRDAEIGFQGREADIFVPQHIGHHHTVQQVHMVAYSDRPALYSFQITAAFYFQPPDRLDKQKYQQISRTRPPPNMKKGFVGKKR